MPFTDVCIYQVKPQKAEGFESLMPEAKEKKAMEQRRKNFWENGCFDVTEHISHPSPSCTFFRFFPRCDKGWFRRP